MEHRRNSRGSKEYFVTDKHLKLEDLEAAAKKFNEENERQRIKGYIFKDIPDFPQPEFHVSHLQHDTNNDGLRGIKTDGGFGGLGRYWPRDFLQWWSLAVKPEDVTSAERRLLEKTYPDRTQAQAQNQRSFLGEFASSPAFMETSRLGSYRFTFSVEEVLKAYSQQFCKGAPPVMRVYETKLYKQEVVYVVLVHSPEVQGCDDYPLLSEDDPEAVCCYRGGHFIWRSQAMCGTHYYELVQRPDKNQMEYQDCSGFPEYYVWDNVAIALHMEVEQVLMFDDDKLRKNLTYCEQEAVPFRGPFDNFEEAQAVVEELWPDAPLQKQRSLEPLAGAELTESNVSNSAHSPTTNSNVQ